MVKNYTDLDFQSTLWYLVKCCLLLTEHFLAQDHKHFTSEFGESVPISPRGKSTQKNIQMRQGTSQE